MSSEDKNSAPNPTVRSARQRRKKKQENTKITKLAYIYSYVERSVRQTCAVQDRSYPLPCRTSGVVTFVSSSAAILLGELLTAPMQRLKVLLQIKNIQQWRGLKVNSNIIGSLRCMPNAI